MKLLDVIQAEFRPRRTDNLRTEALQCVGRVTEWQACWLVEGGPHDGQWAMAPRGGPEWPFAWAPLSDLKPVGRETTV